MRCVLVRGAKSVHLEPKVMDVLVCLARRAGEVVSKEDLLRDVWDNRFVTGDVITVAVHELRKALGDPVRHARFIETITRRGYRWIPPIEEIASTNAGAPKPAATVSKRVWIAAAVAVLLVGVLGAWKITRPAARSAVTVSSRSPEAVAAFRRAQQFLDQRTPPAVAQALSSFEEAVKLDPAFAEAYAGISRANVLLADFGMGDRSQLRRRAVESADRAMDLKPGLPEALVAKGMLAMILDWDFAVAEKCLRRATELDPAKYEGHQVYAWLLSATGRHEEAIAEARRAVAADPASPQRYHEVAWALIYSARYRDAIAEIDHALRVDPKFFQGYIAKGMTLELMGNTPAAYAAIRSAYVHVEGGQTFAERLDATYRQQGLHGIYRAWLRVTQSGKSPGMPPSDVWQASLHSRLGEVDQAIAALERAYQRREGGLAWLQVEPSFTPLRYDARYQGLVQRIGLAK